MTLVVEAWGKWSCSRPASGRSFGIKALTGIQAILHWVPVAPSSSPALVSFRTFMILDDSIHSINSDMISLFGWQNGSLIFNPSPNLVAPLGKDIQEVSKCCMAV